jgi:hypothetical protein
VGRAQARQADHAPSRRRRGDEAEDQVGGQEEIDRCCAEALTAGKAASSTVGASSGAH